MTRWTISALLISVALLLSLTTSDTAQAAEQEVIPASYGAPYFNNGSPYPYGGLEASTVQAAIDRWWVAYQDYWGVDDCSYNLTLFSNGEETGHFAYMDLVRCGGGNSIYGTAFCPAGYDLDTSGAKDVCIKQVECGCGEELVDGQCVAQQPVNERVWQADGDLWVYPHGQQQDASCPIQKIPHEPRTCESDGNGPSGNVGNPIDCTTGIKTQSETDYSGSFGLDIVRKYSSTVAGSGAPAGVMQNIHDITLNVDASLDIATLLWPDGGRYVFDLETGRSSQDDKGRLAEIVDGWEFTRSGQKTYRFAANGELVEIGWSDGRFLTFSRQAGQSPVVETVTVTNHHGDSLVQDFGTDGRLLEATRPDGEVIDYQYDVSGRLESVTLPELGTRQYHYEDAAFPQGLTGITDENGERFATWAYDGEGRAILSEHTGGAERTELEYLDENRTLVRRFIDAGDYREEIYHHERIAGHDRVTRIETNCTGCLIGDQTWEYDTRGYLISHTDELGELTQYQRNNRGLELSRTKAVGTPEQRTVTTEWHADFRLPTRVTEPGRITSYTYDGNGNRLSDTVTDSATGQSRTTSWTYNEHGQVLTVDGPRTDVNDITTYTYDAQGNVSTVTNALGQVTRYTDYDAHGNPLRIVDANGIVTELEYDLRQRLVRRTVAASTADAATTVFNYDSVGQLTETTLPNGASIRYDYDAAHRLVAIEDNLGNRIDYTLDAMGNRIEESVSGPAGNVFRETSREYNTLNRLVASIGGEGQRTTYDYDADGNRTGITDAAYNTTTNRFDALDRLFETVDALGGVTQYHYDPRDNLAQVVDPRGVTTGYTYNGFNELTETVSPDAGTTTYAYDKAGNRTSQTDARGITVQYQHDALNRLVFIDYPEPADGSPSQDITYVYDEGPNGIGRLSHIEDETGSTGYYYGPRGNLLSKVSIVNGIELAVDYSVDTADNLTGMHYPSGATVNYSRDAAGRVTAISLTGDDGYPVTLADTINYAPFGPITGMSYGNGITETRRFDRDGRITRIRSSVQDAGYSWNAVNNITGITDHLDGTKTQSFGYDALYRLTHATGSYGNLDWQYDAVGNRTQQTTDSGIDTVYGYEQTSNRLANVTDPDGSSSYQYDETGNTLSDGDGSYSYDARNRLTTAVIPAEAGTQYEYAHNALGQRVSKPRFQIAEPGDSNGDGIIDENDLHTLRDIIKGNIPVTAGADCNQDGNVNNKDVNCIANQIGGSKNNGTGKKSESSLSPLRERAGERGRDDAVSLMASDNSGTIIGETLFAYDETGHLIGEYDEGGEVIREYIWLGDRPVAMLDSNGSIHYIHADHLNTPQVVTDDTQTVVWKGDYTPFGEVEETVSTIEFNLRFPGQYYDAETGLNYNWMRSYDASLGRFIESDPIGLSGGYNTYTYVENQPTRFADPTGLVKWKGSYFTIGGGYRGFTGQYFRFVLSSECVDGRQALITINANAIGFGGGLFPVEIGGGTLEFDDGQDELDPFIFNGGFRADMLGFAFGPGYGVTGFVIGGVVVGGEPGMQGGLDFGSAAALAGKSEVREPVAYFPCEDECK